MPRPVTTASRSARGAARALLPAVLFLVVAVAPAAGGVPGGPSGGPGQALVLTEFLVTPANVTVGGNVTFVAVATGGVGPLNYSYADLPAGCTTANLSVLPCTPSATGVFAVVVTVRDATGANVSGAAVLSVLPPISPPPPPPAPLVLLTFLVYPTPVAIGNYTVFVAAATGGTSPLSYVYANLPPGCLPLPLPVVPCRPTTAGDYVVTVRVVDAHGNTTSGATALVVDAAGTPTTTSSGSGSGASPTELWTYAGVGAAAGAGGTAIAALLLARWRQARRRL